MPASILPKSYLNDRSIDDKSLELLVNIYRKCNRRIYCVTTIATLAKELNRKEDTIVKLARGLESLGYLYRFTHRLEPMKATSFWLLNQCQRSGNNLLTRWNPIDSLKSSIIDDYRKRLTRPKRIDLQLKLATAEEELGKFTDEGYGGDEKLLSWSRQRSVAENDRIRMEIDYSNQKDQLKRILIVNRLMWSRGRVEWIEYCWDCEKAGRAERRKECIKALWDLRENPLEIPDDLQMPWMAPGTFLRIPNRLFSQTAIQRSGLPGAAAAIRRLGLLLYNRSRGFMEQETTIQQLSKLVGNHPDTVGDHLRALDRMDVIKLEYKVAASVREKLTVTRQAERLIPTMTKEASKHRRLVGVRITLPENRRKQSLQGDRSGHVAAQYYPQARLQLIATE